MQFYHVPYACHSVAKNFGVKHRWVLPMYPPFPRCVFVWIHTYKYIQGPFSPLYFWSLELVVHVCIGKPRECEKVTRS